MLLSLSLPRPSNVVRSRNQFGLSEGELGRLYAMCPKYRHFQALDSGWLKDGKLQLIKSSRQTDE